MKFAKIIILSFVLGCVALFAQPYHNVVINEILASNVSTNAEIADFNDFSDWIELYNRSNTDADIGGCFITDNRNTPAKWKFPAGTIVKSKSTLLIWTDGFDDIPGKEYQRPYFPYDTFVTRYHHANFKLDRAGEFIGFTDPSGLFIDSLSYGRQESDVSFGRLHDGDSDWVYFGEPTPSTSNSTERLDSIVYASPPTISLPGGFYIGTQTITVIPPSPIAEIRYTLDGSKPVSSSLLYTAPLQISEKTVLSVRVFETGKVPSTIITQSYFVDIGSQLPVLAISTPPMFLWDPVIGIYDNNYKSREVPIHFEFYTEERSFGVEMNASLSLTGQASLLYPQKSFTISADDRFGADMIEYQIFPQRKQNQFTSLYLRNAGVPDNRSTFFRDALLHSLLLNKVDIDCQAYRPVVAFLNMKYWGIYNIRDKIDRFYIGSLYNINPDDVDMMEYEANITPTVMEGNADNYNAFYDYVTSNDLSQSALYHHVEAWMDIDEYINYMISGIYDDNMFWMEENVRMWRERKSGARWRWILHDADYGLGMPNWRSTGYNNNTLRFATSSNTGAPYTPPLWSTVVFRKLLSNSEFKTTFIRRFASFLNSIFHPDTVITLINQFQSRIAPEMPRHINRWKDGAPYFGNPIPDYATWLANVTVLREFALNRPFYQREHIIDYFELDGTCVLDFKFADSGKGRIRINEIENVSVNSKNIYFKGIPTHIQAIPDIGYRFVRWEGISQATENPVNIITAVDTLTLTAVFEKITINTIPFHISRDTTFTQDHSPYYAISDVVVDSGCTLLIQEGVQILFPENSSMIVHGKLIVDGTETDPVIFSSNEFVSQWGALCFVNASDSSALTYIKIIGATKGPDFTRDRAAISGYHSRISLQHVSMENVLMPIFIQHGSFTLRNSKLHTTFAGDLVNVKFADYALIENCDLMGNESFDSDGIDYDGVQVGIIRNNRIYGLYGYNSDAIDLGEEAVNVLVENNLVYNISDKGVSVGQASTSLVKRNVFVNCDMGIGVKDFNSHVLVEHNTFYGNNIGVASYEKILGHGGGNATIVNSIIANSIESSISVDNLSTLKINYSVSNTDSLPGLHNMKVDPDFVNDLYLSPSSHAIDAGNPTYPTDPDGSLPDIGAHPFVAAKQNVMIVDEIHYHPVEGENFQFIELKNISSSALNLNGYKISGSISYMFGNVNVASGEYIVIAKNSVIYENKGYKVFQWDSGMLPAENGGIQFSDNTGVIIDFVNYHNRAFWTTQPDGTGPSLELYQSSLENMTSKNWSMSYVPGGTPGASRGSAQLTGIFINEFMADNDSTFADENGEYDDWIEIYNSNDFSVDVAGFYVTDDVDNPRKYMVPINNAQESVIPPKGFLVLWADGQMKQGVRHVNIKLDKAGEQIGLAREVEGDFSFIDSISFSAQQVNQSFGRSPDGSASWKTFLSPTPGAGNIILNVGSDKLLPDIFVLRQNYPNPFNPTTTIRYAIPKQSKVKLVIYNVLGQVVSILVNEEQSAGWKEVQWNASTFSSGIYFYKLHAGNFVEIKKMVFLK